jgi:hypothetical protein
MLAAGADRAAVQLAPVVPAALRGCRLGTGGPRSVSASVDPARVRRHTDLTTFAVLSAALGPRAQAGLLAA